MERIIKLSLEKAKEFYSSDNDALKQVALQAFTEDELQKQRVLRWENLPMLYGTYCIDSASNIFSCRVFNTANVEINNLPTRKHAESALAFSQISLLCHNSDEYDVYSGSSRLQNVSKFNIYYDIDDEKFKIVERKTPITSNLPIFKTYSSAELFVKHNEDLLRKYFMI